MPGPVAAKVRGLETEGDKTICELRVGTSHDKDGSPTYWSIERDGDQLMIYGVEGPKSEVNDTRDGFECLRSH